MRSHKGNVQGQRHATHATQSIRSGTDLVLVLVDEAPQAWLPEHAGDIEQLEAAAVRSDARVQLTMGLLERRCYGRGRILSRQGLRGIHQAAAVAEGRRLKVTDPGRVDVVLRPAELVTITSMV